MKKAPCLIAAILLAAAPLSAYRTIPVVAVDTALWDEIRVFEDWTYTDCRGSFVEYPDFVGPTIHYVLHFIDERRHKIEVRLSRHDGEIDENAHVIDYTDYAENVIRIRTR